MSSSLLQSLLLFASIIQAVVGSTLVTHNDVAESRNLAPPAVKPVVEPAITPRQRLLGLGNNNKNNGGTGNKNNPVAPEPIEAPSVPPVVPPTPFPTGFPPTPFPTFVPPTNFPTIEPPTDFPTIVPPTTFPTFEPVAITTSPSNVPSSTAPTEFPTSSPSLSIKGYIELQLSLLISSVSAMDIMLGKETELVKALKTAVIDILCTQTDIDLVEASTESGCNNRSSPSTSVLRHDLVKLIVEDKQTPLLNFTLWKIEYPVVAVGQSYMEIAFKNGLDGNSIQDAGIRTMEQAAQLALLLELLSGDVDARLPDNVKASAVDRELSTFLGLGYTEPLNPSALHALRMTGIIMLAITSVISCMFMNLARSRKKEREWDERFKELASGGLVTEEGLDYLLEAGRSSQERQQLQDKVVERAEDDMESDDDNHKIPLPGSYMDVDYHRSKSP